MPSLHVSLIATAIALGAIVGSARAVACSPVTRSNVVPCALAQSLETQSERAGLTAADGRRRAARTWLPSNPALSLNAGAPVGYGLRAGSLTWGVSLAQELEIGGQRGRRVDVAGAEHSAQSRRIVATAREVARAALVAYFDALAARERATLASRLGGLAQALNAYARSRLEVGLVSPVETSVAQAEAVRLSQLALEGELRFKEALLTLTSALGRDPALASVAIDGALEPLTMAELPTERLLTQALAERADAQVALAEQEVAAGRASVLRAARVPNPTVSVYYRKDWFEERVAGIGLSVPLPLPSPAGRTFSGEIAEADALARRAGSETQKLRRDVRLQVLRAKLNWDSRQRERALFTPESLSQAELGIDAISDALRAQKIAIRDALLSEQALVEFLLGGIEARHQLCLASVELAHAAGLALERGAQ